MNNRFDKKLNIIILFAAIVSCVLTGFKNNVVNNMDASISGIYLDTSRIHFAKIPYEFSDSRNYGSTTFPNDKVDFEAYTGIRIDTSNNQIKYCVYHHTIKNVDTKNVTVNLYNAEGDKFIKKLATLSIPDGEYDSEWVTLPDELGDGLYMFESSFPYIPNNTFDTAYGYVYIENGYAQTCRVTHRMGYSSECMDKLTAGKKPKDYLSNAKNTYPTNGLEDNCVHREEWEKQADSIIEKRHLEKASDEAKVFFFAEWLRQNTAYDMWRVSKNNNESRAKKYSRWNDDSLWMYYNHVGQCWDYVNAMAIMCRHAGIPCADLCNSGHTVTCVYMRDRWYAVDASAMALHTNWDENPDPEKWTGPEWDDGMSTYFGYYEQKMDEFNGAIWEPKNNGLGKK